MDEFLAKTTDVEFKVADLVCSRNHHRRGKLDIHWLPYYVVVEKTGSASYRNRDQLTSSIAREHAEYLWAASIEEWEILTIEKPLRKILLTTLGDTSDFDSESETERA